MLEGQPGLRERKKQRTRERIVDEALRLFAERGFDATTVADIAAAADIAPRTFFGYFAAKEAVVFHDFEAVFDRVEERMGARAPGEGALDALRAVVAELLAATDFTDEGERLRRRLIAETPALREHDRALTGRLEHVLAAAVARDLGVPPDSVRPRMVAAAATAAMGTLEACYEEPEDAAGAMVVIDELLTFLRGGIDALAAQPPGGEAVRPRA